MKLVSARNVFIAYCVCSAISVLLMVGCSSKEEATSPRMIEAPKRINSAKQPPKADPESESVPTQKAAGKMLAIEKVLKRNDLPHGVRKEIWSVQGRGKTQISESDLEDSRFRHDVMFAAEKLTNESWQPVLAKSPPASVNQKYSNQKMDSEEIAKLSFEFLVVGIDHFSELEFEGVSPAMKQKAEKLFRKVYKSFFQKLNLAQWNALRDELTAIYADIPEIRKDPLLNFCMGRVNQRVKNFVYADTNFTNTVKYLRQSNYPARFAVDAHFARVNNDLYLLERKNPGQRFAELNLAVKYWLEHDFRATNSEHRIAYAVTERFIKGCKVRGHWELLSQFLKFVSSQKQLPVWIRAMSRGKVSTTIAWHWRGSGFASTVDKDSWKPFEQYQKIAAEEFKRAYDTNPLFPESAASLIGISMTGHNEESEDFWFEKAIDAQVDYMAAYRRKLISLLPQWGGSVNEMFEFAKLHADRELYDTRVPTVILDFYDTVLEFVSDKNQEGILEQKKVAECAINAIDGMTSPSASNDLHTVYLGENQLLTLKAIVAAKGGVYDVARKCFEELGDDYDLNAVRDMRLASIELTRGKAYALSGNKADECKKLVQAYQSEKGKLTAEMKADIVEQSAALMKDVEGVYARDWVKTNHDKFRCESEFALGLSAVLPLDKSLGFWTCVDRSQFKPEVGDSVSIDTTNSVKWMSMRSLIETKGNSKTIEFSLSFPELSMNSALNKVRQNFAPSVSVMNYRGYPFVFGLNNISSETWNYGGRNYESGRFYLGWRDTNNPLYYYTTEFARGENQVRLKIAPGYFEAYLNDRFICRSASKEIKGALDSFEICQSTGQRGRGKAKISGIRLEQWFVPPPPIRAGAEKLVAHYKLEFDEDPSDKWVAFWYAQATHMAGDIKAAVELYKTSIENGMPKVDAAFFIGDCYDRQGNASEAVHWYRIAASYDDEDVTTLYYGRGTQAYSNPCHWAATRLAWLMRCSPDESVRESIGAEKFCRIWAEDKHRWVVDLIRAMDKVQDGQFDKAIGLAEALDSKCSEEDKEVLNAVLDSWRSGKVYRSDDGEEPPYLKLNDPIPFFRCFEDYLAPSWNGIY